MIQVRPSYHSAPGCAVRNPLNDFKNASSGGHAIPVKRRIDVTSLQPGVEDHPLIDWSGLEPTSLPSICGRRGCFCTDRAVCNPTSQYKRDVMSVLERSSGKSHPTAKATPITRKEKQVLNRTRQVVRSEKREVGSKDKFFRPPYSAAPTLLSSCHRIHPFSRYTRQLQRTAIYVT